MKKQFRNKPSFNQTYGFREVFPAQDIHCKKPDFHWFASSFFVRLSGCAGGYYWQKEEVFFKKMIFRQKSGEIKVSR